MKIAIIGSGVSGMTSAWLLHRKHQVTVFEAGDYVGGHTHTVDVNVGGRAFSVDTGFIVCNDRTYPNFLKLVNHLEVTRRPTEMGFSVSCNRTGLEYSGSSVNTMYAQRRNLIRPSFHRMVLDILKFNKVGSQDADHVSDDMTVQEYLDWRGLGKMFSDYYLLPMGASIWSCPVGTFAKFPIRFILQFYRHHGLLSISNRPQWYVIEGGSKRYVEKLTAGFSDQIHLNCPVIRVKRFADRVAVTTQNETVDFDEVVFACHSDQALKLLDDPSPTEVQILEQFPYEPNEAVLHTDSSVLPKRQATWSSWNYRIRNGQGAKATLTYDMNILQGIDSEYRFCVTLNDVENIDPATILGRYQYSHPIFTIQRAAAQQRHAELIRNQRTSFCGAYWGNGFHEDGVSSGLAVGQAFGAVDILDQALSGSSTQ
ncbi:MAG: FAD-dependent oxidoreductase [Fuerstiella sp.]